MIIIINQKKYEKKMKTSAKKYTKEIKSNKPIYKNTYWYFTVDEDNAYRKYMNKLSKHSPSHDIILEHENYHHTHMSETPPKGKDYVTWRYKYPMYKNTNLPTNDPKYFEMTNGVHQIIYKGKIVKEFGHTGICKNDAMILYHVKKLIYELLKQKYDDKQLYADIKNTAETACIPRYEDISHMNLFLKRMLE